MEKEHDCLEIPLESNHVTRSDYKLRVSEEKLFDGRVSGFSLHTRASSATKFSE